MKFLKSFFKAAAIVLLVWGSTALLGNTVDRIDSMPMWLIIVLFGAGIFFSVKYMWKATK